MARILFENVSKNKEDWLKARVGKVTSTTAYNVLSENGSKIKAFLDILDLSDEVEETVPMYWGKALESIVAHEFVKRYQEDHPNAKMGELISYDEMYGHATYNWPACTPDYGIYINGKLYGLECKTASGFVADDWHSGLPEYPELQTMHQLAIMDDWHGAFVACFLMQPDFIYYEIERNQVVLDSMLAMEKQFMEEHVWPKVAPAPNEDDGSYLNTLYAKSNGEVIELPMGTVSTIEIYEMAKKDEQAAKKAKVEAYNELKQLVGEADAGTICNYEVKWTHKRSRLTITQTEISTDE